MEAHMKEQIYELRYYDQGQWVVFYCGRTTDIDNRRTGHKSASKKGTTDVYCFIRDLEYVNIKWDIFAVLTYNKEDYVAQEDDHILKLLFANIDLTNMKKGDAKWKERTLANMAKAKKAGCNTVKEYKEWDRVERQKVRDAKAAKRLEANKPSLKERMKAKQSFKDNQVTKEKKAEANQQKTNEILKGILR